MSLLTRHRRTTSDAPEDPWPRRSGSTRLIPAPVWDDGCQAIGEVRWRQPVCVAGRVRSVRVAPWADVPTLECTLVDATGGITLVFLGRRQIAGIHPGTRMRIEGTATTHNNRLAILNPTYTLLTP